MQEFLDISHQPEEEICPFVSRLKGVALHCDFSGNFLCKKKVDTDMKEDILGGEVKSLEDIVKIVEGKESGKAQQS